MDLNEGNVFLEVLAMSASVYLSSTPMKLACALNMTGFRLQKGVITH